MKITDEFCSLLRLSGKFDTLEVRIIHALLKIEKKKQTKVTANLIAKEAGLSVTNAYKYLYELERKGLIESGEDKNKVFWLARSSNPFPRLFSYVKQDYIEKMDIFEKLEKTYSQLVPIEETWRGEKKHEQYSGGFIDKAAFLFDIAKQEILITTKKFYDSVVLLEAIKRAVEKNIRIRIIAEELHPELVQKLKKIGIEMRLGKAWPYIVVIDGRHGITLDFEDKGLWFLNYSTDYKDRFEDMWLKADKL